MKKVLTIFAMLLSVVASGQETIFIPDSIINKYYLFSDKADTIYRTIMPHYPLNIGFGITAPAHDIEIKVGDKSLNFDFKGDSLIVTGDAKLDESAKIFIDFCRKYMKTKIDSLEIELQKCQEFKVKELEGKANYIPRMGNSSIYDYTTPIVSTDPLISDVEPIGITNIDFLTFQMLLDYEKECTKDTLRIIKLVGEYASFFVVNGDLVGAVRYEKELSDKGYHYIYNHYEFYDPASKSSKCYYYFVKEATLKGFIQWYKEKAI